MIRIGYSSFIIPLLLCTAADAGFVFVDLEASISEIPWIYSADIVSVEDQGITAVVTEVFRGDAVPGDSIHVGFWEMGSMMMEVVTPGQDRLLVPDSSGELKVVGTPGRGYWLLSGCFDFNAFMVHPGTLDRDDVRLLCADEPLPPRTVDLTIRFAGESEFAGVTLTETDGWWTLESELECLDGLRVDDSALTMGGTDRYLYEPVVSVRVPLEDGASLTLEGMINTLEGGAYLCTVYPTQPVILSLRDLVSYIEDGTPPEFPVLDVHVHGADPAELGLVRGPYMTVDEGGRLHLSGEEGMLDITSLYSEEFGARPAVGFDVPMTCRDPLYFLFTGLPDGPSGHLATDIIDVLAKGTVQGSFSPVEDPGAPRFSITLR